MTIGNLDTFLTNNFKQTQKLGEMLAGELRGGEIICLTGELGSGKTTFAQGVLCGLRAKGPYISPTFVVMKQYKVESQNIYHIDAYRVSAKDILDLGWEEIVSNKNNIVIVEWAERIKSIIPKKAVWIFFKHMDNNQRKMSLSLKLKMKSEKLQLKV